LAKTLPNKLGFITQFFLFPCQTTCQPAKHHNFFSVLNCNMLWLYSEIMKIYIDPQLGFSKPSIFVWRVFSLTNRCSWSDFGEHSKLVIDVNSTTPDPGGLIVDSCVHQCSLFSSSCWGWCANMGRNYCMI